jgi:hypothetical protein
MTNTLLQVTTLHAVDMTNTEQTNSLQKLLDFLDQLEQRKIYFTLGCSRTEAIMVRIDVPGERWEVEFFADGHVEVEVFRSGGPDAGLEGEDALERLFAVHSA